MGSLASGKLAFPITEGLQALEKKLAAKEDYKWRYDLAADRFYTYEELKARRDANPFPDQMNQKRIRLNEELVKDFIENDLRDPYLTRINYEDHEELLPEVFMPKDFRETAEGRQYIKIFEAREEDTASEYQKSEEAGEEAEGDDK